MNNLTISVIENQIFLEVLNELKLFSKFKIKFYKDINLCATDSLNNDKLIVFFYTKKSKGDYEKIKQNSQLIVDTRGRFKSGRKIVKA